MLGHFLIPCSSPTQPESGKIYDPSLFNTTVTSSLSTNGNHLVVGTAALNHDGSVHIYTYNNFTDTWIKKERLLPSHKVLLCFQYFWNAIVPKVNKVNFYNLFLFIISTHYGWAILKSFQWTYLSQITLQTMFLLALIASQPCSSNVIF